MSSRRKADTRCPHCRLKLHFCLCEKIWQTREEISSLKTRLDLILHYREARRTTNTGQLAVSALPNSFCHLYGEKEGSFSAASIIDSSRYEVCVLTYDSEAELLNKDWVENLSKPVQLIVPDGNWRQASKIPHRVPEFTNLRKVFLADSPKTQYQLRYEPKEKGLATMEAIAYAYGFLEGSRVEQKLLKLFQEMVERSLFTRESKCF